MMNMSRRRSVSGASPERVDLAETIEAHTTSVALAVAAQNALEPANQAVWAADSALEDAKKAMQGAKASAGDFALATALGTAAVGERPMTLREARNALQEAEDALSDAQAARDAIKAKIPELQQAVGFALGRAQRARAAVIRVEARETAEAMAAELKLRQAAVCEVAAKLDWLVGHGALPLVEEPGFLFGKLVDVDMRSLLDRVDVVSARDKAVSWQQWAEALLTDATAAMPDAPR